MIEMENEVMLPVSVRRVWHTLLAFEQYPRWHPFLRLSGRPLLGERIDYTFTMMMMGRRTLSTFATIVELEPLRTLAWRVGVRPLFTAVERFELQGQTSRTRLRHWVEYRGLVVPILSRGLSKHTRAMTLETDAALRTYLIKAGRGGRGKVSRSLEARRGRR